MLTDDEKARLEELKGKGELTEDEKSELASLNTKATGKTYSQDEVNGLITKKSREAVEKMLRDLGVEDIKNAKDGLEKLKELQDKDKTELEKAQSRIAELEKDIRTLNEEKTSTEIERTLLTNGVPADKLARYTKLYNTTEGETTEERLKALMEEFPLPTGTQTIQTPFLGGKTAGGSTNQTAEELQAEMDKIAGLT